MNMELVQRQGQVLSPRMIQAMKVLQMTSQELLTHLETAFQKDLVLDMEEHHDAMGKTENMRRKLERLDFSTSPVFTKSSSARFTVERERLIPEAMVLIPGQQVPSLLE